MSSLIIDYKNIRNYLKNTAPYIFVDKAEVEMGKCAHGIKNFTFNEWFFQCHFPDDHIVPGVFQIEAITQTTALAIHPLEGMEGKKILLKKFVNIDFIHGVHPGDQLLIDANIISFRRGVVKAEGEAYLLEDGIKKTTCKAEFQMVVPEMLTTLAPK